MTNLYLPSETVRKFADEYEALAAPRGGPQTASPTEALSAPRGRQAAYESVGGNPFLAMQARQSEDVFARNRRLQAGIQDTASWPQAIGQLPGQVGRIYGGLLSPVTNSALSQEQLGRVPTPIRPIAQALSTPLTYLLGGTPAQNVLGTSAAIGVGELATAGSRKLGLPEPVAQGVGLAASLAGFSGGYGAATAFERGAKRAVESPALRAGVREFATSERAALSSDDLIKAAREKLRALRGEAGITPNDLRRAVNEFTEAAQGGRQAISRRTRELLTRALGTDVADAIQPRTGANPQRSGRLIEALQASTGPELLGPSGTGGFGRQVPSPSGGLEPQGLNAVQRATQRAAEARQGADITSGLQQPSELFGPSGTGGFGKPVPSPRGGLEPQGLSSVQRATQRAARARMDNAITSAGQKPEPTGVGKALQIAGEIPRAIMRTMLGGELSAVTRQGGRLGPAHPITTAKAWLGSMRHLDPVALQAVDEATRKSFAGRMFESAGGTFRTLDEPVGMRDIATSTWPNKLPLIGGWYRWTERTSMAALNAQAAGVMDTYLKKYWDVIAPNMPPYEVMSKMLTTPTKGVNTEMVKDFAHLITVAQGRSPELAKAFGQFMPAANSLLISPHWKTTRIQQAAMDLSALAKLSPALIRREIDPISKEVAKNAVAYYTTLAGLAGVAAASGVAKVGTDPNAGNFGRLEVGPVSYDMFAGNAQVARLMAQMARGEVHLRNGDVKDVSHLQPLWDWLRSGVMAIPGLVIDYSTNSTLGGQQFTWKDAVSQHITNIFAQDIQQALDAEMGVLGTLGGGAKALAMTVPAGLVGVGINRIKTAAQQKADSMVPGGDYAKASVQERAAVPSEVRTRMEADRAKASGVTGEAEKVRIDYVKAQENADQRLASGEIDQKEWYRDTGDREHELGLLISEKYRSTGIRPRDTVAQPSDTPVDWYGRVIAANTDANDKRLVNWDAVESWRASLTPEQDRYIDDHTHLRPLTGKSEERAQFSRDLRQSDFWEIKDKAWAEFKHPIALQYKTYDEYERAVREKAIAPFPESAPASVKLSVANRAVESDPLIAAYRERANRVEMPWVGRNPKLADQAANYGVFRPTNAQTAMIAFKLGRAVATGD